MPRYSKFFGPPKPENPNQKLVSVPPGYTKSFLYYALLHRDDPRKILVHRQKTARGLCISTNPMALRSFYASRRKKRMPITYEVSHATLIFNIAFFLIFLWKKLRWEMGAKQRWKCKICKKLLPVASQVDHVVPLSAGGDDKVENMQLLCANCHAEKSRMEAKKGVELDRGIPNYFPRNDSKK